MQCRRCDRTTRTGLDVCSLCRRQESTAKHSSRTLRLTDKGLRAIGVSPMVEVPLLSIPMKDDNHEV